ncbi:MAG: hypothetical protein ACLTR5_05155 [Oscillospiraceae bacterium]
MSKDRDLILDMTEDPEVLTYPAADNEPLQLGGVGDDASAAADRQVTTPGTCTSRRRCPHRSTARCASSRCACRA